MLAGVGSVGVAWAGARGLAAAGGFGAHPLPFTLAPAGLWWTHAWLTGWGVLELYGANFLGVSGWGGTGFAVLHLGGLALAAVGTGVALRGFLGRRSRAGQGQPGRSQAAGGRGGLVDSVLAVAIVANLVSYLVSIEPGTVTGTGYDAREIAAVLPLGAVLAGRQLGPRIAALAGGAMTRAKPVRSGVRLAVLLTGLLAVLLAGYGAALGYAAAQPAGHGRYQLLADWLAAHGLRYGLGGAAANAVTVDSGGRAVLAGTVVRQGRVRPLLYQSAATAYDPRLHYATFLVTGTPGGPGVPAEYVPAAVVRATFGQPARRYQFGGFTVAVWDVNLLTKLR